MFNQESFKVFDIAGLEPRMAAIQEEIQPIFLEIGELMRERIAEKMASVMPEEIFYLHIAQHRRRTANAPDNTWCAISTKKRGYKMEPHFQLGIWQDYVFLYLSIIDQPKEQKLYADKLSVMTENVPDNFVLSKDHTRPETFDLSELTAAIKRLQTVKKSELEIGRIWPRAKFDGTQDEQILTEMLATVDQLLPIYERLMR